MAAFPCASGLVPVLPKPTRVVVPGGGNCYDVSRCYAVALAQKTATGGLPRSLHPDDSADRVCVYRPNSYGDRRAVDFRAFSLPSNHDPLLRPMGYVSTTDENGQIFGD